MVSFSFSGSDNLTPNFNINFQCKLDSGRSSTAVARR